MKYAIAIIVLCIAVIVYASGPVVKSPTCPACSKVIAEGQDHVFRIVKGKSVPIHYACAYNRQIASRTRQFKQIREGK